MNIKYFIKKHRDIITIILSLIGIGIMAYYDYCDSACSYLKGDIWGIDLKWVGIAYMTAIIVFATFDQKSFVRALLAWGLGVEVHLYAFQVQHDVYCRFCLAFSVTLILSFIINYEVPSAWREKRSRMWLYFLGEADFPMFRIHKLPLLLISILGYLYILFAMSGSVTPAYGMDSTGSIPSLGNGDYEITIFTDYFCPPCKRIDTKADFLLKELLDTNNVKIKFVDVPLSNATPMYVKYYLYAANSNPDTKNILHIRRMLFEAAQVKRIENENALVDFLKEYKISWKKMDEKSIFPLLSAAIKENNIQSTPSCVIKYSAKDIRKFVGEDEIWKALNAFKTHISKEKK
jgi:thiol-disulfide isomerase/thioredoxin